MKYVISVAKAYKHRGRHQHKRAKKHWFVYFYEYEEYEEEWHMKSKQVNWLQAVYYKTKKHHRRQMACTNCGSVFLVLVKSSSDETQCPNCLD